MRNTYLRPKQYAFGSPAILALTVICLLPFLRLSFFAHSYLDDFIFPIMVRQRGVWAHTGYMYMVWQGRFSASLITALHPLAWGDLRAVKLSVFGFLLLFAAVVFFSMGSLLSGGAVPARTRLAAGGLVLSLSLIMLPSPVEAFFWLLSALFYMGGCACCFLLLGAVARLQLPQRSGSKFGWWLLAILLAALAPGFSEMISCFVLALVVVLLPQIRRRGLHQSWMALLGLAVAAAAVATLAPGNFIRSAGYPPVGLIRSVALAATACYRG